MRIKALKLNTAT